MEHMEFNTLCKWFVELNPDEPVWGANAFAKNRDRLLEAAIAPTFLAVVVSHPRLKRLLSKDHFTLDGTLIDAFASMKSFRRKDGIQRVISPDPDFRRGERDWQPGDSD